MPVQRLNNERELLLRIALDDQDAFRQLTDHYWSRLYTVAFTFLKSQEEAKDIVQEIFLKVWLKREQVKNIQNIESWLFILTRNKVLNALKKKRIDTRDLIVTKNVTATGEPADSQANVKEVRKLIAEGLELLPAQQKLIFLLSKEHGLSHEQICAQLNLARSTVKNSLTKALAFLRNYLQQRAEISSAVFLLLIFK